MMIDGIAPSSVLQPHDAGELSEMLQSRKGSVVPVGAATQHSFGNPLRSADYAVDLTRMNRVTEYVPADLTVHVEAGVRLGDLEKTLAQNHQFLPLDPWNGPSATIGGIAAANAQGPYRAIGTVRDWIIGMKVVEADGRISKTGGRVVKNVTGYDLAKLYTGSIGTLAIITEISLKVLAAYASTATAIARPATFGDAAELLSTICKSPLQPVSFEWAGPENEIRLRFGEHPHAVDWQLKNLPPADWRIVRGDDESREWESLSVKYSQLGPIVLRVIGLRTATAEIIREFRPASWIAHAANGIVLLSVPDAEMIPLIRRKYRAIVERAPIEVRRKVPAFGLTAAEYGLMRQMKSAFDPSGRLNPGRHVDGESGESRN